MYNCVFFSSRRRHTRYWRDWSSDVCSSDLRLEALLQRAAQREQRRLPLPALVDAGQAAVVQLVAEVQRELEVVVDQRVACLRDGDRLERMDRKRQRVEQRVGHRTPGPGKAQHGRTLPRPAVTATVFGANPSAIQR